MNKQVITLAHGSGGQLMQELISKVIVSKFANNILNKLDDSAVFKMGNKKFAFTTDSFVVNPIFFNGGDIGKLAVCGTVNDLSMVGAKPLFLSAGLIIEEGFEIADLIRIIDSMQKTVAIAGAQLVCGDTKVVNKHNCDKIFINTSGIGIIAKNVNIRAALVRPNDAIIISGTIAEHGISILSEREGIAFRTRLRSDCAPLNALVEDLLKEFPADIHCLRDPTRGG